MNGNTPKRLKLDVSADDVQQLQCFICKSYLSCSPLRISRDGENVCGRCYPLTDEDLLYFKNPALEFVLRNSIFPCRFQEHGCTQEVLFGGALPHENKCQYRQYQKYDCPYLISEDCSWKGPVSKILDHLVEFHKEVLKEDNEIELNVKEDKRGKITMEIHDTFFIISYVYNSKVKILRYNICYLTLSTQEIFYKLTIYNGHNRDISVNLKNIACKKYYTAASSTYAPLLCMNLEPYLNVLENPDAIVISLNPTNTEGAFIQKSNYNFLESLKCTFCGKYVAPPIYTENGTHICYDCGENNKFPPLNEDENLKQLMTQVSYTCKWPSCGFVCNFDKIYNHEMDCQFRIFSCLVEGCNETYLRETSAIIHYNLHGYQHCIEKYVFSVDLDTSDLKNTVIKLYLTMPKTNNEKIITLNLAPKEIFTKRESSRGFLDDAKVCLQHDHCKKRPTFPIHVFMSDVPKCFKIKPRKFNVTVSACK